MSPASGKPSHPIELPAYLVRKACERGDAEPDPIESGNDPLRSPYAAKRTHQRTGPQPTFVKNDLDAFQSAYATKRAAGGPSVEPDVGVRADHLLDPDPATSLQPSQAANDGRPKQARGERGDKVIDDRDLEDLEASLRRLQRRQAATMQLSRAPMLSPPRSRPDPPAAISGAHSRERMVDAFRSPPSLEPTRLSPPPMQSNRNPQAILGVSIACFLVATIAYLAAGRSPSPQPMSKSQIALAAPRPSTSTSEPKHSVQPDRPPPRAADGDPEISADAEKLSQPTGTSQATRTSQRETVATLQPVPADADTSLSSKAVRALDPEEVSLLIKQGEKHIAAGDVVTARMIFQRAAEDGDATAALALAATYDPSVLAKLGVMGMGADVEKARNWYRMAESYGSAEATQRLRLLDNH
jgi:hypothetical protein